MNKYRICCLTYGELHNMALQAVEKFNDPEVEITCISARYQTVPESVATALAEKNEVFVAGSSNYDILRSSYDVPVVGLEVGYQDYLQHIMEVSKTIKNIGIVTYHTPLSFDFSAIERLLGITIQKIAYTDSVDIAEKIRASGCAAVMGGGYSCEVATRLGLMGVLIYPGIQIIEKAFETAKTMAIQLRREKHNMMYYAAVIGETPNGIISIDHAGIITNYNPSAERYLGVNAAAAKGKSVDELFPQLRLTKTFQQKSRVEDAVVLYRNRQLHLRKILMTEDSAVEAAVT
ncbi:MAG: PrpR N-terminal domain-containing protein, partial [Oscillibacter sp.]